MKTQKRFLMLAVATMLITASCNLPRTAPTATPGLDPLAAAQLTVSAAANPGTSPVVENATPTFTPLPTLSATPAFTPTSAFTPTPGFAYVTLSVGTNCRSGPAKAYDLIDTFVPGQTIEVVGKNPIGDYWYVRSPNNQTVFCWLWGFYATGGNLGNVAVLTPPPSPTPVPGFDVSYDGLDSCVGWWVEVKLKNTGLVAFKSMSISVKDTVTDVTLTDFGDGFEDLSGCLSSGITATLDPGQTYIVSSPAFAADPSGHNVRATITLCTNTGQGGACTTKTIEFTP
ncbi:MAG: hypothetical protein HZB18_00260 [Chloroflexi bacterium]|nr:hypothetical protein [Chloroflexota bacterium]